MLGEGPNDQTSYRSGDASLAAMNTATPFQYRAAKAGLTEQIIREVVTVFYDRIRRDPVLGPVFEQAITDWDAHIERIMLFWLTATRLGRGYVGKNFMPAHLQHRSIRSEHLPRWLKLFEETVSERCSPEGASVLMDIAKRMAETLELALARREA